MFRSRSGFGGLAGVVLVGALAGLTPGCFGSDGGNAAVCGDGTCTPGQEDAAGCPEDCLKPYPQDMLDIDTLWAVGWIASDVYNQNLAGKPGGAQDVTASCPLGGTVHVTGTVTNSASTGITSVDLTYDMTDCQDAQTCTDGACSVVLSATGVLAETGSWNSATGFMSKNHQAASLKLVGTATRPDYQEAAIDETCELSESITRADNANGGSTAGRVCGRTVSWTW
jgi:hypothetical protein